MKDRNTTICVLSLSLQIPCGVVCPDILLTLGGRVFFMEIRKKYCAHYNTSHEIAGKTTKLSQEPLSEK